LIDTVIAAPYAQDRGSQAAGLLSMSSPDGEGSLMEPTQLRRARPDYDQALKRMLTRAHDDFLQLIAPGVVWRAKRSPELPAVARRADLVWEVESDAGEPCVLHIELQTQPDKDIGERVAEYGMRLWLRDHLPVRSVAVFLRPSETLSSSPFVIQWRGQESLRYSFDIVRLWEISAERVLATNQYGLWPLATLMAGASIEAAVGVAERIATAPLPPEERSDLAALLVVLSELRLGKRALLAALRRNPMIDDLVKQSSLAEEFFEEGKSQGLSQGRDEGMRRMVRMVLEGRFGPLSEDLLAALAATGESKLEEIGAHAGTDTLKQIRSRLGVGLS